MHIDIQRNASLEKLACFKVGNENADIAIIAIHVDRLNAEIKELTKAKDWKEDILVNAHYKELHDLRNEKLLLTNSI